MLDPIETHEIYLAAMTVFGEPKRVLLTILDYVEDRKKLSLGGIASRLHMSSRECLAAIRKCSVEVLDNVDDDDRKTRFEAWFDLITTKLDPSPSSYYDKLLDLIDEPDETDRAEDVTAPLRRALPQLTERQREAAEAYTLDPTLKGVAKALRITEQAAAELLERTFLALSKILANDAEIAEERQVPEIFSLREGEALRFEADGSEVGLVTVADIEGRQGMTVQYGGDSFQLSRDVELHFPFGNFILKGILDHRANVQIYSRCAITHELA